MNPNSCLLMHLTLLHVILSPLFSHALTEGSYTYDVSEGKAFIRTFDTSYQGPVSIPSTLGGYPVSTIKVQAFRKCRGITSVIIPNSVGSIESGAFLSCSALKQIEIPTSVTNMGVSVFASAGLIDIYIPGSIGKIPQLAFSSCTNLTSVTIGSGITSIGIDSFSGCSKLSNILSSGMDPNQGPLIPGFVADIGDQAFRYCSSLSSIYIQEGVAKIGGSAFSECTGLRSVTLPSSLISIGAGAFARCPALTYVYFKGNTPITIGGGVFNESTNSTVYFMFDTTGWGTSFPNDTRPTVLWHPQIQADNAEFGVREDRFGFTVKSTTIIPVVVEACESLASNNWSPLQTNTINNGTLTFSDPKWTNYPARFYRIIWP